MTAPRKAGFTLIELSIVLVIIGLLVGGILVGRDLIKAAEIRSQISQIKEIKKAYNTFKLKYNCIAGDCPNATDFLTGTANGNGNGIVENITDSSTTMGFDFEQARFFQQLALANLIKGNYSASYYVPNSPPDYNYPSTKLNIDGGFAVAKNLMGDGVYGSGGCNSYWQGVYTSYDCFSYNNGIVTLFVVHSAKRIKELAGHWRDSSSPYGIWTPASTQAIDSKIDDGLPFSGKMRAANPRGDDDGSNHPNGLCATNSTASGVYNISNTDTACHIAIKLE
jgi:prepilin-type N-terminal cleavage/methylation domain-containing protein